MKFFNVDLYDYYKVQKPENGRADLSCYLLDNSHEIGIDRKHSAMLVLPGGGYEWCSVREAEPVALRYLGFGFCSFVLNYSVAPIRYPYSLAEAIMAMNYIREHAEEFNVDPNKVSAVGFSAGGHLCASLGSFYNSPEAHKIFTPTENVRPDAVILSYPVITCKGKTHMGSFLALCGDDKELMNKLDILNLVNKDSSPAFIWSTYEDGCVACRNALLCAEKYEENDVRFSIHIFGKGQHGLSVADHTVYPNEDFRLSMTESVPKWVELSIEWLKELDLYN